jgi:hypothetical protein
VEKLSLLTMKPDPEDEDFLLLYATSTKGRRLKRIL